MNIKNIRISTIIVLINIYLFKLGTDLMLYFLILYLSIEIIEYFRKISNKSKLIIFMFGIFIVIYRSWDHLLPYRLTYLFNRLEHIAFTSLIMWITYKLLKLKNTNLRIFLTILIANIIGFINELFQMYYRFNEISLTLLSEDSKIDISVNLWISLLIAGLVLIIRKRKFT